MQEKCNRKIVPSIVVKDKYNYISPETMQKAIDYIPDLKIRKWKDLDIEMLFKTLYYCALRPTEGITLSKESFDLEEREIALGQTKTKKQDFAPIPKIYIPELEAYLRTKKPGRLLPGLTYNAAYRWFKRLGIMCNITAWTTNQSASGEKTVGHVFRKSVGKDMLDGKYGPMAKQIPIISKQLRHANVATTMNHYLKAEIEAVKEAW